MNKEFNWFDNAKNISLLKKVFYGSLVLLVVVDFFIHKHAPFMWAAFPVFFVVYGFLACYIIVYFSKLVGLWLKKREDYYGPDT